MRNEEVSTLGLSIQVIEDRYSLCLNDATSDEERRDHPFYPKIGDDDNIEVVVLSSSSPPAL